MRDLHRVDSSKLVATRFSEPLCIVENRLAGDLLPPDSPNTAKLTCDNKVHSSPTSVVAVIDSVPQKNESFDGKSGKNKKKKLFRNRRKSSKDKEIEVDAARQEEIKKQALRMKHIREEEDADFRKIRREEEASPKLDMLPRYPLTLMEEVISTPAPLPVESDHQAEEDEKEAPNPDQVSEVQALDLGRFEAQVHDLRLSKMDLRQFVSHEGNFSRLQEMLRSEKAITDETLKQKLHIFCRPANKGQNVKESECIDIFSVPASRNRGWNKNLPSAYRRMNEFSTEIDWMQEIENDPTIPSTNTREGIKTKKNWSDVKLLNLVSNYSQKGKDSYHISFQHGVNESDMLTYDRNFKDGVDLLTYCVRDLVPIVQEHEVFTNLQVELRKIGAVTNEVLKQGLHFYVRDVRLQKQRREAEIRAMEEKQCGEAKDEIPSQARGSMKRKALLTKLRLRARNNQCHF